MKAVTVTCEDYETLMLIHAVRRLYAGNFAQQLPLPLIVEMNRRLVIGYQHFKNVPKVQEIKEKYYIIMIFLKLCIYQIMTLKVATTKLIKLH